MSVTYFDNTTNAKVSNTLEITLDGPDDLNVEVSKLKYNKEHAITFEIDDGLNDIYLSLYRLFMGIDIPEFDTVSSNGFYFTDGCANNLNYRANSNMWLYSNQSNVRWLDWSDGGHWLNNEQTDIIVNQGNFGAYSHYFYKSAENEFADPVIAVKSYIDWHERTFGFRPLYVNRPGGVDFDDVTWIDLWEDKGLIIHCMLSGDRPDKRRIDNVDFSSYGGSFQVGRFPLEGKTFEEMKFQVDDLMTSEGNQWLSTYGHRVETGSFILYEPFKQFIEYIDTTYGKNGNDTIWVPNMNEMASYLLCRDSVNVNVTPFPNNKYIITVDDSALPYYITDRSLTLKLNSTSNISKIKGSGFNISHNNLDMVNISWNR